MKKISKFLALITAMLMLVTVLAACGSSDNGGNDGTGDEDTQGNVDENQGQDDSQSDDGNTGDDTAGDDTAESDLAYVQDKGTLVVGITEFAPMDYRDENGEWIGFDADLARQFAESLGVDAEFQLIEWDNKVMELDGKTIDVVWNGMTLTDEVLSAMECSNAYCTNAQVVILPADMVEDYPDIESMSDLTFAVESGSAGMDQAVANGLNYIEVLDQATAVLEVSAGTADAAIIDLLMAGAMVGEGTSYAELTHTIELNSEEYGVGFRKGSDLAAELNDFFAEKYADGTMLDLATTYGVQAALIEQ